MRGPCTSVQSSAPLTAARESLPAATKTQHCQKSINQSVLKKTPKHYRHSGFPHCLSLKPILKTAYHFNSHCLSFLSHHVSLLKIILKTLSLPGMIALHHSLPYPISKTSISIHLQPASSISYVFISGKCSKELYSLLNTVNVPHVTLNRSPDGRKHVPETLFGGWWGLLWALSAPLFTASPGNRHSRQADRKYV